MKRPGLQKIAKWVAAPLLLLLLLNLIYLQLLQSGDIATQWQQLKNYFQESSKWWLVLVLLLAPCNWMVESVKWQLLNKRIYPISLWRSFCSILTGIAFAMITPGKVGEFAGRMLHFPNDYKVKATIGTFLSNIIQSFATTFGGLLGLIYCCIYYPSTWNLVFLSSVVAFIVLAVILSCYRFQLKYWIIKFKWGQKLQTALQALSFATPKLILQLFILSCFRFLIYNTQFLILANLLGAQLGWQEGLMITFLMFWMIAIIPSFLIADIGVRGFIAGLLFLQTGIVPNAITIFSASYVIWLLNLVLPAILGSLFVLKTSKYFKSSKMTPDART